MQLHFTIYKENKAEEQKNTALRHLSIDSVVVPIEPDNTMSDDIQRDFSNAVSNIKNKADELWKEYKRIITRVVK